MARPVKKNVDYFSHDTDMRNDRRIRALRNEFGPVAYAMWCMLLEVLGDTDEIELRIDEEEWGLLAGDFGVGREELKAYVERMVKLRLLQREGERYWSEALKERVRPVLEKRIFWRDKKKKQRDKKELSPEKTPQSKGKESKRKEKKGKENKVVPPPGFDLKNEKGADDSEAEEFYFWILAEFERRWKERCSLEYVPDDCDWVAALEVWEELGGKEDLREWCGECLDTMFAREKLPDRLRYCENRIVEDYKRVRVQREVEKVMRENGRLVRRLREFLKEGAVKRLLGQYQPEWLWEVYEKLKMAGYGVEEFRRKYLERVKGVG